MKSRRRVARQLHDELGQDLVAAKMMMDNIAQSNSAPAVEQAALDASKLVGSAIRQVRERCPIGCIPRCSTKVGLRSQPCNGVWRALPRSSGIDD